MQTVGAVRAIMALNVVGSSTVVKVVGFCESSEEDGHGERNEGSDVGEGGEISDGG